MPDLKNSGNKPNRSSNPGPDGDGGKGQPPKPPQSMMSRGALGWILLVSLAVLLIVLMNYNQNAAKEVSWQEFLNYAKQSQFEGAVRVEDDQIVGILKSDTPGVTPNQTSHRVFVSTNPSITAVLLEELRKDTKQDITPKYKSPLPVTLLIQWGPVVVLAFLLYFFIFRSIRNAGGGPGGMLGSFGRSKHKMTSKEHTNVTLADVAGIEEAKSEVVEIIEFLKNPKKFQRLGGRVPRGVLLIGEPGCGKTLLARAVAGEADVPFFSISGSDFVEMFVGVGASRVRDLFKQAKENSPCIIFLDEIDAVGRKRGSGFASGGHDEREQTLNAILVEMDGFDTNDQVIVMAATNRADVLDPALIRPGRFDRQIHVVLPDLRGRLEILKVHSRKVKMSPDVNLEKLARGTPMFSGADLSAIINEAAISATLLSKDFVEQDDLEEARDKVKWGRSRKSHKIEEDERKVIAYHEAGHAIVMLNDAESEPLHKVTIIPRGTALGVTFMLPERDRHIRTKKHLLAMLRTTFGGRIAEELFCDDISSGAAGDIRQATDIARAMVTHYGMSEKLGFVLLGTDESKNPWEQPDKMFSDDTARLIDTEVKAFIDQTYAETKALLTAKREELDRLAKALLQFETLNREEVERVIKGQALGKLTIGEILKNEQNKSNPTTPRSTPPAGLDNDTPSAMPSPA